MVMGFIVPEEKLNFFWYVFFFYCGLGGRAGCLVFGASQFNSQLPQSGQNVFEQDTEAQITQ